MANIRISFFSIILTIFSLFNLTFTAPTVDGALKNIGSIKDDFLRAKHRYLFLDFDNSISPLTPELRSSLKTLATDDRTTVSVITARPFGSGFTKNLEKDKGMSIEGLKIATELGWEMHSWLDTPDPNASEETATQLWKVLNNEATRVLDGLIAEKRLPIGTTLTNDPRASKTFPSLITVPKDDPNGRYHYIPEYAEFASRLARRIRKDHADKKLEVYNIPPSHFINVLPKGTSKATTIEKFLEGIDESKLKLSEYFRLSIGDEPADEPMHKLMNDYGNHSIFVRNGEKTEKETWKTVAKYQALNTEEAQKVLIELANSIKKGS